MRAWAVALACLNQVVDGFAAHGNFVDTIPAWCKLSVAIIQATPCVLATQVLLSAFFQKRAEQPPQLTRFLDVFFWAILPAALYFLPFGVLFHRSYMVYEDVGCYPAWSPAWLSFGFAIAPMILCAISLVFLARQVYVSRDWNDRARILFEGVHIVFIVWIGANVLGDSGRAAKEVVSGTGVPLAEWMAFPDLQMKLIVNQVFYILLAFFAVAYNLKCGKVPTFIVDALHNSRRRNACQNDIQLRTV
ncbi:hypothetical protein C8R46DRAFT_1115888 [Mycena filopes]|nr:hypothetical protein C8R46DRAFT_1115888 [Mycena filopes]